MTNQTAATELGIEWVTLLDGRRIDIDLMGRNTIATDTGDHLSTSHLESRRAASATRSAATLLKGFF